MESQGRVPSDEADGRDDQSADIRVCTGIRKASLSRCKSCDVPGEGGALTPSQLTASGYKQIEVEFVRDLHELAIHKFNESKGDFALGFWNGYGCALKAIIEKLQQSL
jgi:hypothetical protein